MNRDPRSELYPEAAGERLWQGESLTRSRGSSPPLRRVEPPEILDPVERHRVRPQRAVDPGLAQDERLCSDRARVPSRLFNRP